MTCECCGQTGHSPSLGFWYHIIKEDGRPCETICGPCMAKALILANRKADGRPIATMGGIKLTVAEVLGRAPAPAQGGRTPPW